MSGWFYDNPAAPMKLVLCPSTCDAVSADARALLEIVLGCRTITDVPR
jgi:hypothetical protein